MLFVLDLISEPAAATDQLIFEIVEFVHFFLIGTVLYITAMGLFQLFVTPLDLPQWLKADGIEDLELNLVGVVVVVMGVNLLNVILDPGDINLPDYGAGYALPIAALALFIFVRSCQANNRQDADDVDSAGCLDDRCGRIRIGNYVELIFALHLCRASDTCHRERICIACSNESAADEMTIIANSTNCICVSIHAVVWSTTGG